jgi:hypothetical protein
MPNLAFCFFAVAENNADKFLWYPDDQPIQAGMGANICPHGNGGIHRGLSLEQCMDLCLLLPGCDTIMYLPLGRWFRHDTACISRTKDYTYQGKATSTPTAMANGVFLGKRKDSSNVCAPSKPGYTLKVNTTWNGNPQLTVTTQAGSPSKAEETCNSSKDCIAWNSQGYVIEGERAAVTYEPLAYQSLCLYVKDLFGKCPDKTFSPKTIHKQLGSVACACMSVHV